MAASMWEQMIDESKPYLDEVGGMVEESKTVRSVYKPRNVTVQFACLLETLRVRAKVVAKRLLGRRSF